MTFGQRLKELRKDFDLTQQELADQTHIARSTIGMYEQDRREPDFDALDTLADRFGVDFNYLLGRSDVNTGYPMHDQAQKFIADDKQLLNRMMAYYQKIIDAYKQSSPDTQAAVRAILHLGDMIDGDR